MRWLAGGLIRHKRRESQTANRLMATVCRRLKSARKRGNALGAYRKKSNLRPAFGRKFGNFRAI